MRLLSWAARFGCGLQSGGAVTTRYRITPSRPRRRAMPDLARATPPTHPPNRALRLRVSRSTITNIHARIGQELIQECERVVHKTFPACVAFHKPSLIQQLKSHTLEASLTNALLCCAARYVPPRVLVPISPFPPWQFSPLRDPPGPVAQFPPPAPCLLRTSVITTGHGGRSHPKWGPDLGNATPHLGA